VVRVSSLEIHKEAFSFSAGHFTIFSATDREQMHGHNYHVSIAFEFELNEDGLSFDYRHYKRKIRAVCETIDRHFLLPTQSPHLKIEERGDYWVGHFNQKEMLFLKEDIILLPISNITIEELSQWMLDQITSHQTDMQQHGIHSIELKVHNGPEQSAGAKWQA